MRSIVLKRHRKRLFIVILAALLVAGAGAKLFDVGPFHKKDIVVISGKSFSTKGEPKAAASNGQTNGTAGNGAVNDKSAQTAATLITPSGDFVSNHHPNLSGTPAPSNMSSVCNTTPGASCKITFTKDGTTKTLSTQTADANGSTYWYWKLQDIGLTAGSWKVQAIASLNGQTKSASDAMDLVVTQ